MSEYQYLDMFTSFQFFDFPWISSWFIFEKQKDNLRFLLRDSPMGSILGWFLYFKTHLNQGQRYCNKEVRSLNILWYSVIFLFRKETIQNFTTILLIDATLFDKNGLMLSRPVNSNSPGNVESLPLSVRPSVLIFFKVLPVILLKKIWNFELMLDYS